MSLRSIALTFLVFLGAWYWLQARERKELALKAAARHCDELALKLLDDSVVLQSLRLQRNAAGRSCLVRHYRFDFTSTGEERYQGELILAGKQVVSIKLPPHRV